MKVNKNGITGFHEGWLGLDKSFSDVSQLEAGILGFDKMKETSVFFSPESSTAGTDKAEEYKGIYNENEKKLEAIVSQEYTLLQHTDAFLPVIDVLRSFNLAKIHGHYGCTGKRAMVVINFDDERLNVHIKNEVIQLSLYLKHGVDGTLALWGTLGGFRVVCSNGMVIGEFLGQERWIHVGDKISAKNIPKFFEKIIQQGINNHEKLSRIIEQATAEIIKEKVLNAFLRGAGLGKRYVTDILEKCKQLDEKNRWNIYNAVTEFITHEMERASFNSRLAYLKKANKILVADAQELIEAGRKAISQDKIQEEEISVETK